MGKKVFTRTALTGGGDTALDEIDGLLLSLNDMAFVTVAGIIYTYLLNNDSVAAESSPDVICPNRNYGTKRWILQSTYYENAYLNQAVKSTSSPTFGAVTNTQIQNSMARAFLAANQTGVADGAWAKVNCANESFDIGGNYDTTNKRYVAPVTGYYRVDFCVGFTNVGTVITIATSGVYVNGAIYAQGNQVRVPTAHLATGACSGSSLVYAVAGQYIELYGYVDTSDSSTSSFVGDAGGVGTYLSVNLVSL